MKLHLDGTFSLYGIGELLTNRSLNSNSPLRQPNTLYIQYIMYV